MHRFIITLGILGTLVVAGTGLACSGSAAGKSNNGTPRTGGAATGDSHVADDLDTDDAGDTASAGGDANTSGAGDSGNAVAGTGTVPGAGDALVTFELKNTHDVDLEFAMDKGWSLAVSGYSGKPPKAVPIMMFPKACTASCDLEGDARCPVCDAPKDNKAEKAAQQRQVVKPGESFRLPWDGQVLSYKGTRMNRKPCSCYTGAPVTPNTYTLRACGLRVTKSAKKMSKFQCVTQEVVLPPAAPTVITFDFGKP